MAEMGGLLFMKLFSKRPSWADVAVFEDLNAGKEVERLLTKQGFAARTYDDKLFRYFLFLRPPRETYRVQIRQTDAEAAVEFLAATAPDALQKAIHCPSCGSRHIAYPQMTRKFLTPTILLHLGIIFRVIGHECYCEHCHFTWNLPGENVHAVPRPSNQFPL
jgi:hypothetical protein